MREHPLVVFRDGPAGRRPALIGGPEIVDVIGAIAGGDVPTAQRRHRAAELLDLSLAAVDAALEYYGAFPDEVDAELQARQRMADELEERWRRGRQLLDS
jgi:hypothetical protein